MHFKLRDYWIICKPRVVMLMLFTATIGMFLASHESTLVSLNLQCWLATMGGITCLASAAAAVNHILERNTDVLMQRTKTRPLASGRMPVQYAWLFTVILSVAGWCILFYLVNYITAVATLLNALGYAFFYTLLLKPTTSQNIVIGGLFGAMPPLLGWLAVRACYSPAPLILVMLIFTWTPMHFWALAIYRYQDYLCITTPMLPVTHGITYTKIWIFLYSALTIIVSIAIFALGVCGWLYLLIAGFLDVMLLCLTSRLLFGKSAQAIALTLFLYSMLYLFLLFLAMACDHYWWINSCV